MCWQPLFCGPMGPHHHLLIPIVLCAALLFAGVFAGCVPLPPALTNEGPDAAAMSEPGVAVTGTIRGAPALDASSSAECVLAPITPPVMPAEIPGYAEVDPATGLHMTGTVQQIDLATYRLKVTGKVDRPLSLTYDELRCMPRLQCTCTLICPGLFTDRADWAGASLAHVLELAGIRAGAAVVRLVSADGYSIPLTLDEALSEENFLAYEQGGEPLPILHGFPVRAVLPSQMGGKWIKWLVEIKVE